MVNVVNHDHRSIRSLNAKLSSELGRPCALQEVSSSLALGLLGVKFISSLLLGIFSHEYLLRGEVFEDLVLDLENLHAQPFVEWILKFLTQKVERVKNTLLRKSDEELFLQLFPCEVRVTLVSRFGVRNLQKLFEKANNKLNHILMLLVLVLSPKAIS